MLDLDYIGEIFSEAQSRARKREWYGLGFRITRRPERPLEHCGVCGLPWWWHERWGCRAPQHVPMQTTAMTSPGYLAHKRRLAQQQARYRARRSARVATGA